jgi:hypothetical protein
MSTSKKKTTKPRTTRTKSEILEEFESVRSEVEPETIDAKTKALLAEQEVAVRRATSDLSSQGVVQKIGLVGLDVTKTLTNIQNQVLAELDVLSTLRQAVDLEKKEIERLHQVDVTLAATNILLQEYADKEKSLEESLAEKQKLLENSTASKKEELDKGFQSFCVKLAEDRNKQSREWEREKEEYTYQTALQRKKDKDEYEESLRAMTASVKEIAQQKEKAWAEREKLLQSAEKELADLRQLQLGMDARIKVEVDKHVAIATNALKKDLTSGFVLEKKDLEQRIALESQSAAALAVQNTTLEKRIGQLETELIAARESVKEMALAAFKEAGSSKALAEVTSFSARENNSPTRSRS